VLNVSGMKHDLDVIYFPVNYD